MSSNNSHKEIDFIDYLFILWSRKGTFLFTFVITLLIIYATTFFTRIVNFDYTYTIHFQEKESQQTILSDVISQMMIASLPNKMSLAQFESELNETYFNNLENNLELILEISKKYNLNKKEIRVIQDLAYINGADIAYIKNNLVFTTNTRIHNKELERDSIIAIENVLFEFYDAMLAQANIKFTNEIEPSVLKLKQYIIDKISLSEKEFSDNAVNIEVLEEKLKEFDNLIGEPYWNNFKSLDELYKNHLNKNKDLEIQIEKYKLLNNEILKYVNDSLFKIDISKFQSGLNVSKSLASNNVLLILISTIISLFFTVLVIYLQTEIKNRRKV